MSERPAYRTLDIAPNLQFFNCAPLMAVLSTQACGQRWAAAAQGAACHQCPIGRMHHADHNLAKRPGRRPADKAVGACLRCGRTDLRIIVSTGTCISCWNREREWRSGCNAKGKAPATYQPLRQVEVAVRLHDGRVEARLLEVRDQAEALGRVAHGLPGGASIVSEWRATRWNAKTREHEIVCPRCGVVGLVLERQRRNGSLEYFHWCCDGSDPPGDGWRPAQARQQPMAISAQALAEYLSSDQELDGESPCAWTPAPFVCSGCHAGQLEARVEEGSSGWQTRCRACGADSG